ncbi:MAG TPA: cytochrome c [Acidiphilium sp.]|nr:cytochrome c [Acidiphilium sp.]HQU25160.1 cytochrome c [Acidiphilium sp.]
MTQSVGSGAKRRRVTIIAGLTAIIGATLVGGMAFGALNPFAYQPTPIVAAPDSYPAVPQPNTQGMSAAQIAQVQRGRFLTVAGDCMPCHSAPGGKPFAGGLSFVTPFGTLYSPNITPDKKDGIGNWNDKQFYASLHEGIAPGGSLLVFPNYLYPAMPYTSYAKLSKPDVLAIAAYLKAIPAVASAPPPNDLHFPFNIRAGLLTWRLLFFSTAPVKFDKSWSPAVRNGAYLAQALGHCSECHSPRNILFAIKQDQTLAGANILGEPWYAPNISSSKTDGVGGWSKQVLVSYLRHGGNMQQGSAFGPMKSVVDYSLSQIPKSDVADIADYLQTATAPRTGAHGQTIATAAQLAQGKTLYEANCAACHQSNGAGIANVFPNLAGNQAAWAGPADNLIGVMLGGMIPWHANGPAMPAYNATLNDHQIAAIANYVRTAWHNPGVADATAAKVLALRKTAPPHAIATADPDYLDLPPIGSAKARALGCPLLNTAMADPGDGWLNSMSGVTTATLPARTQMLLATLKSKMPGLSNAALTNAAVTAYCPVVATSAGLSMSDKRHALATYRQSVEAMLAKAPKS